MGMAPCVSEESIARIGIAVYIHIGVGFDVARSTLQGIAKASVCGTGNKKNPRLPFYNPRLPWVRVSQEKQKSMNTAKAFVAIAMMGLVVASCSSDSASDSNPSLVNDQIQFATSTQPIIHTRAVNNADNLQDKKFQQGEAINVYLTKHGTTDLLVPKGVTAAPTNCYKFTVGTAYTGTGSTENSQTLVAPSNYVFQFPGTDGVDVYAIHPATDDANVDKSTNTFSVKEDQTADADYRNSDLIAASAGNHTKADGGTIMLDFAHKLSKVVVKLQVDDSENLGLVLEGAKIKVNTNKTVALTHDTQADGTTTLTLGATSNAANIIIGDYDADKGTAGIIIPQTFTAGVGNKLITVVLANGASFSYTPTDDETFEPEKEYVYTLTLKAEMLTLVSLEIKPWTTVERTGDAILD